MTEELVVALRDMLRVYEMLMPGVRYIAVSDYRLLNEAPIRARQALRDHAEALTTKRRRR